MTPIRPTGLAPTPPAQPVQRPDAGRLAAQRAFFDMIAGKTPAAAAPAAAAAQPEPAVASPQRIAPAPAEPPARILRPGSLLDIRV
ncbi:hypothetical protein [Phenylobacterium sp.]|uniref:hypothetical protein n=1 Tax=Phenylobacterium sp. TaxID=1871053 RepID=UPI0035B25D3B